MKILLDTCTFLWVIGDSPALSKRARGLFMDPENEIYLSSISAYEIAVKHGLGRLPLPGPADRLIPSQRDLHGVGTLPLDEDSALHVLRLPQLHRDPFDRMLVSQAIVHGLVILTPDPLIHQYPVRTDW